MDFTFLSINWNFAISLSIIGYLIVLFALTFLFLIYKLIPIVLQFFTKQYLRKKDRSHQESCEEVEVSGEVSAAISMALYYYLNEQHDAESGVMTIKAVSKKYSPWSSKIYGMRQPLGK